MEDHEIKKVEISWNDIRFEEIFELKSDKMSTEFMKKNNKRNITDKNTSWILYVENNNKNPS